MTATTIGQVIIFKSESPLVGIVEVTALSEIILGETATRFFNKTFRYSTTNIVWSDWSVLNLTNLQSIVVKPYEPVYFEFSYERAGTDATGSLSIEQIDIDAELSTEFQTQEFSKSFPQFSDPREAQLYSWTMAVLAKIYEPGIVAQFVQRGIESQQQMSQDQDYIDFWRTVTYVFSLCVELARKVENFHLNSSDLSEFLRQKGLFLCGMEQYDELAYLARNFYDEIRLRGTAETTKVHDRDGVTVNGEILRLICYKPCDEFIYTPAEMKNIGWNINNSSPMYLGIGHMKEFVKGYEQYPTAGVIDLTKYPTFNPSTGTVTVITDGGVQVVRIAAAGSNKAGIGIDYPTSGIPVKPICVDSALNYEISCRVRFQNSNPAATLSFGVIAFDEYDNVIPLPYLDPTKTPGFLFFDKKKTNINTEYYEIKGVLFNYNEADRTAPDDTLSIGFGNYLKMTANVKKIIPYIAQVNTGAFDSAILVKDIKVAINSAPYSFAFIESNKIIHAWIKNNNNKIDYNTIYKVLREYFVPYNAALLTNTLVVDSEITSHLYWETVDNIWIQSNGSPWAWY